jgi:hypothetical protein
MAGEALNPRPSEAGSWRSQVNLNNKQNANKNDIAAAG